MIDDRSIQQFLKDAGFYTAAIDGDWGANSRKAALSFLLAEGHAEAAGWSAIRCRIAVQQCLMHSQDLPVGPIDGCIGPSFRYALEVWQNRLRDSDPTEPLVGHQPSVWPRQRDVPGYYGEPAQSQTLIELPFPMTLAWDTNKEIHRFSMHKKVAESAQRVFQKTLAHFGHEQIKALRLDRFGGCLNHRPMRGGSKLSMHSWGIAIDIDPERNQLRWGRDRARMARAEYKPFLAFWQEEGWISLGRERDYDWMHVQAARL